MKTLRKLHLKPYMSFGIFLISFIFNNFTFIYAENLVCWEMNLVPYTIGPGFSEYQRNYIKHQIGKINKQTCIYWSDIAESEALQSHASLVKFIKSWNYICQTTTIAPNRNSSRRPLWAVVTLGNACFERRSVLHEIVHALGFVHEQQRIDRDCYVWVSHLAKRNFNYKIITDYRIPNMDRFPYDKASVMHYERSTHLKALSERFYEWEGLGSKEERLTDLDLWKIQYRFCGRPHYCEVHPQLCKDMERQESEMNCTVKTSK